MGEVLVDHLRLSLGEIIGGIFSLQMFALADDVCAFDPTRLSLTTKTSRTSFKMPTLPDSESGSEKIRQRSMQLMARQLNNIDVVLDC